MCDDLAPFVPREAVGSYAENQRITAVRKVYQRGVINPMINIEAFWKEYCNFEHVSTLTTEYAMSMPWVGPKLLRYHLIYFLFFIIVVNNILP